MGHHKYSPSKYNAWTECLCYEPCESDNAQANAGTEIHRELSLGLKDSEYEADNPTARWGIQVINGLADGAEVQSEVELCGVDGVIDGIIGTADVIWIDRNGSLHVADMKSFSDGTTNYLPQLKGYAALYLSNKHLLGNTVFLHVLHGGIRKVETVEVSEGLCLNDTVSLLNDVQNKSNKPTLCKWCQYCSKIGECMETNNAMTVVGENGVAFNNLSLCQKLVVCDAVIKLAETLKEQARALAEASEDHAIEMDGIRYELKPWAGRSKCNDLCALAGGAGDITLEHSNRNGTTSSVPCIGITPDEFIALCDVSKSAVVDAIRAKNADNREVKKVDIERWVGKFFSPTEGKPHFVRTK